jgi:hypothetical protein
LIQHDEICVRSEIQTTLEAVQTDGLSWVKAAGLKSFYEAAAGKLLKVFDSLKNCKVY